MLPTQDEYRNTILKNAALARRFNEVKVNAPSAEDTFKILQGHSSIVTEAHRNIELPDAVLKAAVWIIPYSIFHNVACQIKLLILIDVTAAHFGVSTSCNRY